MRQPAWPPEHWRWVTIPEIIGDDGVFVDGDWVESRDQDPDGDVRLIQLADIGEGKFIDKSARFLTSTKAKALKCTDLESGDVLIARMPDPLGRACVFPGAGQRCVTVVDVCIVRPDPRLVDARFLCRLINANGFRRDLDKYIVGTTRQRISRGNLAKIQFALPPMAEQKRIAAVLDKADALRAKRRQAIATLDTLLQSVFLDMFGDPVTNPKGWSQCEMSSLIHDVRGGANLAPEDFVESGFPVLHKGAINRHGVILLDRKKETFVPNSVANARGQSRVDRTFMAVTLRDLVPSGPSIGLIVSLQKGPFDEYLLAQGAYGFRTHPDKAVTEFLIYLSNAPTYRSFLRRFAVGSTQIHMRMPVFMGLRVHLPPIALQREFGRRVAIVDLVKSGYIASLARLDTLFVSLQSAAFTGTLFSDHRSAARAVASVTV